MKESKILLVDDDELVLSGIGTELKSERYKVTTAKSGEKAIKLLEKNIFDLVITDLIMGDVDGFAVVKKAKELYPETTTMVLTGYKTANFIIDALRIGVDDYMIKPNETDDILFRVRRCLEKRELQIVHAQAYKTLKQSKDRLSMLFKFAPDAYYLSDQKGTFLDGNKAAEDLIGYKKEELIGRNYLKLNLLPSNQIFKAMNLLARNALGKPTGPDEFTLIRKDGVHVYVEIRTYSIKLKNETLVLGIARDITERKKAEEARGKLISDLQAALAEIKTLSGIIPICAKCKKIRDDDGYWKQVEEYVRDHTEAEFSHGLCPKCAAEIEKEIDEME